MSKVRNAYHDNVRRDVFPFIPVPAKRLLDVGGGVGATASALKNAGMADWTGVVDLVAPSTEEMDIDFAYAASLDLAGTYEAILQEHGQFNTILCLDILEHLKEPWDAVKHISNLLAPGGYLIASIPNVQHASVTWPLLRGRWELADDGILDRTHIRFFTKRSAVDLMMETGLELDLVTPLINSRSKAGMLNTGTAHIFENFLARQFLIRMHKKI